VRAWRFIRNGLADARPWAFTLLLMAGFAYVAVVLCGLSSPLQSGNPGYWDFAFVALTAPLLYLMAATRTIRPFARPWGPALFRNGLLYAVPFFIALHWEMVGDVLGANFSLNPQSLSRLSPRDVAAMILAIVLIGSAVGWHAWRAHKEGILAWYAGAFVGILALIAVITLALRGTHTIHIHHYTIGGLFALFWRFNHPVSAMYQGFFLGMYVEGIARWGRDPNWIPIG